MISAQKAKLPSRTEKAVMCKLFVAVFHQQQIKPAGIESQISDICFVKGSAIDTNERRP
jgi:hypothetical protein